jgi:prepilin-type processing-associated H-X9-DG protein
MVSSMKTYLAAAIVLFHVNSSILAQDAIQIAERAPRDSLLVVAWSGADKAKPSFETSHLGEFWAQPPVQSFVLTPLTTGWAVLKEKLADDIRKERFDLGEQIGGILWHQPGLICVFPVEPDKTNPGTLGLAVEWSVGSQGPELSKKVLAVIKEDLGSDAKAMKVGKTTFHQLNKAMPVFLAMEKDRWTLVIGENTAKKLLEDRTEETSFARNACHKRALKAIGKVSPFYYYVTDFAGLRDAIFAGIGGYVKETEDDHDTSTSTAGLMGIAATFLVLQTALVADAATLGSGEFAVAYEFDGLSLRKSGYAKADEKHPFAWDFVGHKPLDLKRLSDVPAKAVNCQILTFDAAAAYAQTLQTAEWYLQEIGKNFPKDEPPPTGLAAKIRSFLGLDIEKDFLAHLGDHAVWFTATSRSSSYLLVAIDLRDRSAVESFLKSAIEKIPPNSNIEEQEIAGKTGWVIRLGRSPVFPLAEICVVLGDARLIICTDTSAAGRYISYLRKPLEERNTITNRPSLRKFLKQHEDERISWIQWDDEAGAFQNTYPQLASLCAMAAVGKHAADLPIELGELPPPIAFTSHMAETVSWTALDGSVRIRHDYSGLGFATGAMSVSRTALAVSVLLPSLSRARELSKRTVCMANLRGIGQAMYIYANSNDHQFPPDFESLVKDAYVAERQLVCPSSDAKAGDLHACYEYIPGQSESDNPRNVLIYEINDPHKKEGCNVLFQDGHVEFISPYSKVKMLVEDTKARLQEQRGDKKSDK